jgi:hypothetical protein
VPVDALRHDEKRANIPTEELHDFVAEDERAPSQALYPRDPSLDPQLVWKGKDEQDREPLAVPSVPIYIQEKVHPRVIVENLRETAAAGEPEPEMTLFDDFDGIEFEELVDVVGRARADLAGRRVVDVDAADLNHEPAIVGALDGDVGLAEDHEQVARAGLLEQLVAHGEVGVHAHEQHRQPAEGLLLDGDRPAALPVGLELLGDLAGVRVEGHSADEQQVEADAAQRLLGRLLDEAARRPCCAPAR